MSTTFVTLSTDSGHSKSGVKMQLDHSGEGAALALRGDDGRRMMGTIAARD